MKKSLLLLLTIFFSSFSMTTFGMLVNRALSTKRALAVSPTRLQKQALYATKVQKNITVSEYLQQKKKKTSDRLDHLQKQSLKDAEEMESYLQCNIPDDLYTLFMLGATAKVIQEFTPLASPLILRKQILDRIEDCINRPTSSNISEEEKIQHSLDDATLFIQNHYSEDTPDKKLATKELNKIKKQLRTFVQRQSSKE